MRIAFFFTFLSAALSVQGAVNLLERFDSASPLGEIREGAQISLDAGLEKGALCVSGNKKPLQYFYTYPFDVAPGEKYSIGLNYKTTPGLNNRTFLVMVVYEGIGKEKAPPAAYFPLTTTAGRWAYRLFDFTVPQGTKRAHLMLRLANVPPTQTVWVDHLRLAPEGKLNLSSFETSFENWCFDRHLIFDRFLPGPGGSIVNEWKQAKVGEAFFQAVGNREAMQYPLWIENLTFSPKRNYVFEAWIKATQGFAFNGNGMLIFFFKDAEGRPLGQSRYHIRPTGGEWKELIHSFTTPEKAVRMDIGLNMRHMAPAESVQLDQIRFYAGKSAANLRLEINPDKPSLTLGNAITSDIAPETVASLEYEISGPVSRKVSGQPGSSTTLDLASFPDGVYQAKMTLSLRNGNKLESSRIPFSVCKNPYWRNDIGILNDAASAPAPWQNLKFENGKISTWNNLFLFKPGAGLEQITFPAEKLNLLSEPLSVTLNGESVFGDKVRWTPGNSRIAGVAPIQGPGWRGELSLSIDYMGFLHNRIAVAAEKDMTLQTGDISFRLHRIEFLHRSDDSWTEVGAVDMKKRKEWSTNHFYNEVQIGEMDRGLVWYAPKLYPAAADFDHPWLTVNSDGRVKISFINAPLKLKKGEKHLFEFALSPYPFRPMEENWKKLRFRAGKNSNFDLLWQTSSLFKYCGSTATAANPEGLRKLLAGKKGTLLFYQFPFYIMDNIPEWSYFEKRWKAYPARAYDLREMGGMAWKGNLRDRDWQDLYLKIFADHLQEFRWDGVYYDCFGTDVFTENGELFHPVFDCRKFQERIYLAQRMTDPKSLTVTHTGAAEFSTAVGFSDIILMGEQYRAQCIKHTYPLEFLTLDEFRYENAVNLGPDRMFLPQYRDPAKIQSPAVATHILGLVLTHNLMLYPNFINKEVELSIRNRQFDFGMENSTFHPYWLPKPEAADTDNPALAVSYWRNPKGFLMVILNPTGKPQTFRLKTVPGKVVFFNPLTGKEENGPQFKLEPYMSALVRIFPENQK